MKRAETVAWCRQNPEGALEYALSLFEALSAEDRARALAEIEELRLRAELRGVSVSEPSAAG
jgi:hypothetical protein